MQIVSQTAATIELCVDHEVQNAFSTVAVDNPMPSAAKKSPVYIMQAEELAMKTILFAIVIGVASVLSAGQGQGDGEFDKRIMGNGDDPVSMVRYLVVQKELNLSDEQKAAIKQLTLVDYSHDLIAAAGDSKTGNEPDVRKRMDEMHERHRNRLNDIFTPEQRTRMQEIVLQYEGGAGLRRKDIAAKLILTDDQKSKLDDIFEHTLNGKPALGRRPSIDQASQQAIEVLTPEQLSQFEKMKGKPVEFDPTKLHRMETIQLDEPRPKKSK
jgi:Spy/CpxP family protein refolding chaperone